MKKKIKMKRLLHFFILFIFIIILLYSIYLRTSSRYVGQTVSNDSVIAIPILTLSNNTATYTASNMKPGDVQTYDFQVSNYENGKINEVLLEYYFTVNVETVIPLTVEIYDITDGGETLIPLKNGVTDRISINYGEEILRKYRLKIIWDVSNNDVSYADKSITCNIALRGEQVV